MSAPKNLSERELLIQNKKYDKEEKTSLYQIIFFYKNSRLFVRFFHSLRSVRMTEKGDMFAQGDKEIYVLSEW